MLSAVFLFLSYGFVVIHGQFEVPDAKVEVFDPKGFKVSIPDQEGISLFAFHGKINQEIEGREAGTFSRDILKAKDGRWTFYDPSTKLNIGDKIHFWTYVDYNDGRSKLGYPRDDQVFEVKEIIGKTTTPPTTTTTTTLEPITGDTDDRICKVSDTKINNGQNTCKGNLIFSDEFDGQIKQNLWTVLHQFAGSPDYEFVVYLNRPETLQVENQILKIKPVLLEQIYGSGYLMKTLDLKENCTGTVNTECRVETNAGFIIPPVASSRINTKNKFSFKYGSIEIRAKLPKGDWIYPELFLNPINNEYGPDYKSGQIRVAFVAGNSQWNKDLRGGIILGDGPAHRSHLLKTISNTNTWTKEYHTFRVNWNADSITVAVDGRPYGTIYPPEDGFANGQFGNVLTWKRGTKLAPFDKEMYITLGVGVGGFCFEDDPSKPWKNGARSSLNNFYKAESQWHSTWDDESLLEIDYVKAWAL